MINSTYVHPMTIERSKQLWREIALFPKYRPMIN